MKLSIFLPANEWTRNLCPQNLLQNILLFFVWQVVLCSVLFVVQKKTIKHTEIIHIFLSLKTCVVYKHYVNTKQKKKKLTKFLYLLKCIPMFFFEDPHTKKNIFALLISIITCYLSTQEFIFYLLSVSKCYFQKKI